MKAGDSEKLLEIVVVVVVLVVLLNEREEGETERWVLTVEEKVDRVVCRAWPRGEQMSSKSKMASIANFFIFSCFGRGIGKKNSLAVRLAAVVRFLC